MRVTIDGVVRSGRAVDCRDLPVDGRRLVAAVRGGGTAGNSPPVRVDCPPPSPVHEHVGHVGPDVSVAVRVAVAAVARQRGATAPQDDELARVESDLAALDPPPVDLSGPRERLAAAADADVERLRERVAARRGAVEARRALDADPDPADERLGEAAARLAELETDLVAAEQSFSRAREQARAARDTRERRLRLQDRADNLRRAAREHLAGRLREAFADAVAAVPGKGRVPDAPASFDGDPVTAALAVARLADLRAPVVLAVDRFETPAAAARALDAPVALVAP